MDTASAKRTLQIEVKVGGHIQPGQIDKKWHHKERDMAIPWRGRVEAVTSEAVSQTRGRNVNQPCALGPSQAPMWLCSGSAIVFETGILWHFKWAHYIGGCVGTNPLFHLSCSLYGLPATC